MKKDHHHPVTLRQMGAARRQVVTVWKEHPDLSKFVLRLREGIERTVHRDLRWCGLGPLPPWMRTLERIRRWVGTKITLYHLEQIPCRCGVKQLSF